MELSIQPFYERNQVRIYCGNSYKLLPQIPDGSAGLVLTDPMYNIGFDYSNGLDDDIGPELYETQSDFWLDEGLRIASTVVFTPGQANLPMWYSRSVQPLRRFRRQRQYLPTWMLSWYKGNSPSIGPVGQSQWEPVLVYGEVENRYFPDVFHAPIDYEEGGYFHPTPKPELWASELLRRFYTAGTTVIDPFCGSGTTAVACLKWGIPYIGIDIVEKFCEGTAERLKNVEVDEFYKWEEGWKLSRQ